MPFTASIVDVCTSDYLLDHHNRDGEYLVGHDVDGTTTLDELRVELKAAAAELIWGRDGFDWEGAHAAIDALFAGHDDLSQPFDASLPTTDGLADDELDYFERPTCWVLLKEKGGAESA